MSACVSHTYTHVRTHVHMRARSKLFKSFVSVIGQYYIIYKKGITKKSCKCKQSSFNFRMTERGERERRGGGGGGEGGRDG